MKAPDKIYIQQDMINNIPLEQKEFDDDVEYIRKNALLEWANEQIKVAKANNLAYSPFEKLIDKLNDM